MEDTSRIGSALPHDSARKHVTGEATYVEDMPKLVGQRYACVGRSSIASGKIISMDLQPVLEAQGVIDVISASDIPGGIDIGPVFPGDPLLTDSLVEYVGQPIFAVLATSHERARKAVTLANIEYQLQTPVLDLQQAIDQKFFVRPPHTMQRGEADTALAKSKHRFQGKLRVGGQEHFYLEGQASTAIPEEDGCITVHTSSQNPTEAQKLVAEVLGLSMNQVKVVTRRMGGAFGGKETQGSAWSCIAAIFALRNQCAVTCRLSRQDDMVMTGKRHSFLNRYDVGCTDQGEILGIDYRLAGQCGYSPDLSDAIVDRAMFHCDNAYFIPDIRIEGLRCKTNTVSNTAFRGFGGPQGMITVEAVIDQIAYTLGKDPLEIRKRNLYNLSDRNLTPYHQEVDHYSLPRIIDQLEVDADYWNRREAVKAFNEINPVIKKGLALTPVKFGISFTVSHLNQAGALVHVYSDGSIHLNHGGTEMGQGLMVKISQIVAEEFQVSPENIIISATQTDKVPNTSPTAASSGTDINGMAALNAARKIKNRIIQFLSEKYDVPLDHVKFKNGEVFVEERSLTFAEVAHQAWMGRVSLSATGFYKTPKIHYDRETAKGRPFLYFANGAAVSEVIIDTLTGECRLSRVDILHDVGNSINPAIDIGQIEGGFIQGLGWLTCEELQWDTSGRLLTDSPATYKIPAISDTPAEFNVSLLKNAANSEPTVFRSKAVGEPPLMLAISAWCAIRDAIIAASGSKSFPILHAPATPEEVLRCIHETGMQQ
ncbi:MAG: xanthine dehydrogenase molybdopterin binding subunit [Acidiferrobacterales bacterium]|nr:xanthine dehydrogenase molybdopterin binding subunit [Acidiferrobacterales bacterium]